MTNAPNTPKSVSSENPSKSVFQTNIPKLRFPEFNGEWEESILSENISLTSGFPFSGENFTGEGSKVLIPKNFTKSGYGNFEKGFIKYTNEVVDSKYLCKKDDLLILLTDLTSSCELLGKPLWLNEDDYLLNQRIVKVETNLKNLSKRFLLFFLLTEDYHKYIVSTATGSTVRHSSNNVLLNVNIHFPSLPEQQKIANFLTAVDTKIAQLSQKLSLLEAYKKGAMQGIFSQKHGLEGLKDDTESVQSKSEKSANPCHLRFRQDNGNNYPDWEEKRLGEVGNIVSGLTYNPNDINEAGTLVLRSSNVKNRTIVLDDNVYVKVDEGDFNPVLENDILICVRNGSSNLIGKNAIIKKQHEGLAFGAFMSIYRSVFNLFLFHYFDSKEYKKDVYRNLGATINSINGSDLKKFKVPFPCSEEQTKIANFLSAIDAKIDLVKTQLENTQAFKKGLLQQMFV